MREDREEKEPKPIPFQETNPEEEGGMCRTEIKKGGRPTKFGPESTQEKGPRRVIHEQSRIELMKKKKGHLGKKEREP